MNKFRMKFQSLVDHHLRRSSQLLYGAHRQHLPAMARASRAHCVRLKAGQAVADPVPGADYLSGAQSQARTRQFVLPNDAMPDKRDH